VQTLRPIEEIFVVAKVPANIILKDEEKITLRKKKNKKQYNTSNEHFE